jgi:hypothetical protein
MGSAIAQIVAENKNGNPRMFGAIREFPFRFPAKLSGKKFSCKGCLVIELLQSSFGENFHSAGVTGGDNMAILSRGDGEERATKVGIGERGIFGRFNGDKRSALVFFLKIAVASREGVIPSLWPCFETGRATLPCPIGA